MDGPINAGTRSIPSRMSIPEIASAKNGYVNFFPKNNGCHKNHALGGRYANTLAYEKCAAQSAQTPIHPATIPSPVLYRICGQRYKKYAPHVEKSVKNQNAPSCFLFQCFILYTVL